MAQKRTCKITGQVFEIREEDIRIYDTLGVPYPTISPLERQRRRTSFRNFRNLYNRKCDKTGKKIISMYEEGANVFPVYEAPAWWQDSWSALDYGQKIDFSRPFFEQYKELSDKVPRMALQVVQCENCSYSNMAFKSKNCYLVFGCVGNEDCMYGHIIWECKDCLDNLYAFRCELCSNSVDIVDCYNVHYSSESLNCKNSYFLHDCQNCHNCFGGYNLRNAQYCFFNEQLTKEEYEKSLLKIFPLTNERVQNCISWLDEIRSNKAIFPEYYGISNENVVGNHVYESKGLYYCFDSKRCEDSSYCFTALDVENSIDLSFIGSSSRFCVEGLTTQNTERVIYSALINTSYDIAYSEFCFGSHDLFGCNGLRNASYCILNKQYSKDEYFKLKTKLIEHMKTTGEWGEFFPMNLSPFAYNESIASEYMPLNIEEVLGRGLRWKEFSSKEYADQSQVEGASVCAKTGRKYRITSQEIEFYKKLSLPLATTCPDVRHEERMNIRAKRELTLKSCSKCGMEIKTAHATCDKRKVCCMECYKKLGC